MNNYFKNLYVWIMYKLKLKKYTSLYRMPFVIAKPYLKKVYIDKKFITDFNVDLKTMDLKVIKTRTSLVPGFILNEKVQLNKDYIKLFNNTTDPNLIHVGYKYFDEWKYENGDIIGNYVGKIEGAQPNEAKFSLARTDKRMIRLIQRNLLGLGKYFTLRVVGRI
jgi:hypothetical protein